MVRCSSHIDRHCRHRGQHDVKVAIWSRRIICLIRVNQALPCRVFLSGKGQEPQNLALPVVMPTTPLASGLARVFPFLNSTTGQVSRSCPDQALTAVRRVRLWFQEGNCFMSIKSKVLAAAATLTMVGGVGTVGVLTAGTAGAATPSCGHNCIDIFSRQFGTHRTPNFVVDVFRQGAKVGQPIILFRTSNSDPAEDFTVSFQGLVSDFFQAGLVSAAVNLHYGGGVGAGGPNGFPDEPALELEYSPYGVGSGLCVGLFSTAFANEGVTLQPCGVSSKTVWILDTFDKSFPAFSHGYFPAINGSDTHLSH